MKTKLFQKLLYVQIFILQCYSFSALSQETFDIQFPQNNRDIVCQRCFQVFSQKPKEVGFSIKMDKTNTLYFEINDKKWFNILFKNAGDGIAVDVVSKDRYGCLEVIPEFQQIRGELLKPVYAAALKKTLRPAKDNKFRTRVGRLPDVLKGKEVEFNILFLSDKNLCQYYNIFNLESYQWDLLDMGMYLDSITYKTKLSAKAENEQYSLKQKTLTFTIPFEKNKSIYSQEDIKPLYDSLRLTDFNIRKIDIKAYASVEGNAERNLKLQNERASSIVEAMQAFQEPTIETKVSTSENWVEFLNDITGTSYDSFKSLSKNEVKQKLVGGVTEDLEKYLRNHRKAVVRLELERIDKYKDMATEVIISLFNQAIGDDNLDEATALQNSIFERLKGKEANPDVLSSMEMPRQLKYVPFFNKNSAFRYLKDERNLLIAYNELQELEKLAPKDKRIKYNIAALKMRIWRYNVKPVKEANFKTELLNLKKYGINKRLINRMLVNYHIIKSELYMRERDYANKDKAVAYIVDNYKNVPLQDYDYLSLAQFLTYYADLKAAEDLLQPKMKTVDVDENLLFYYLNLTLVNKEIIQNPEYRTIMLNAINLNKERFCRLFNASNEGGVTFQLLEDDYLHDTYCESCEN
jgi:outer membrane protein OmpA-like peptidoglycan-associated protein